MSWAGVVPPWGSGQLHVVTAWGDEGGEEYLDDNPAQIKITDSDDALVEDGEAVQTYTYDEDYYNPDQPHEGPGWYLSDYWMPVHYYLMNVTTLSEATYNLPENCEAQKVIGSYKIIQDDSQSATGLYYVVGTYEDYDIYRYDTVIDRGGTSTVEPNAEPPRFLTVEWDFDQPVGPGGEVIITTEFVLCEHNTVEYSDVYFTYGGRGSSERPAQRDLKPAFRCEMVTTDLVDTSAPGISGGHVIGAFELYSDSAGKDLLGEFRFEHEYNFDEDPEEHDFTLTSGESPGGTTYYIGSLRFGHSYGYLYTDDLWSFEDWITNPGGTEPLAPEASISVPLDWDGLLPYPCFVALHYAIPAVSKYGLLALGLVILGAAVFVFRRRRAAAA